MDEDQETFIKEVFKPEYEKEKHEEEVSTCGVLIFLITFCSYPEGRKSYKTPVVDKTVVLK